MSYCVHCGVELARSERDCPLCGTQVQNPSCAWEKPEQMPYPETPDVQNARIDRPFARRLVALMMCIPALMVVVIDLLDGGSLIWSLYVIGALALLYCWIVVPVLYKFTKPYIYVVIDLVSLNAYVLLIAWLSRGVAWYTGLMLPLLMLTGLILLAALLVRRRVQTQVLHRLAVVLVLVGVYLLGLEVIISLYARTPVAFRWSFYAAVPAFAVALTLWLLQRNTQLMQEIKKRLFI